MRTAVPPRARSWPPLDWAPLPEAIVFHINTLLPRCMRPGVPGSDLAARAREPLRFDTRHLHTHMWLQSNIFQIYTHTGHACVSWKSHHRMCWPPPWCAATPCTALCILLPHCEVIPLHYVPSAVGSLPGVPLAGCQPHTRVCGVSPRHPASPFPTPHVCVVDPGLQHSNTPTTLTCVCLAPRCLIMAGVAAGGEAPACVFPTHHGAVSGVCSQPPAALTKALL